MCGGMPIVYTYMCGGYLQHFETDMIIGPCALHWSIHSFIQSVNIFSLKYLRHCCMWAYNCKQDRHGLCIHRANILVREREWTSKQLNKNIDCDKFYEGNRVIIWGRGGRMSLDRLIWGRIVLYHVEEVSIILVYHLWILKCFCLKLISFKRIQENMRNLLGVWC